MALEKCNELNNNAPLTKNLRQTYYVKSSYEQYVFSNMFEYETAANVQKINSNDGCTYNNNIYNSINMYKNIPKMKPTDYVQLDNNLVSNFYCLDNMTDDTKKYITKVCDVILDDDYDISKESDKYIITYYRLLRAIPVLYEIVSGCYDVYDTNQRNNTLMEINQLIDKMNQNSCTLYINNDINISNLIQHIKNDVFNPSQNTTDLCNYIFDCRKDMLKLKKYNNNKKPDTILSEICKIVEKNISRDELHKISMIVNNITPYIKESPDYDIDIVIENEIIKYYTKSEKLQANLCDLINIKLFLLNNYSQYSISPIFNAQLNKITVEKLKETRNNYMFELNNEMKEFNNLIK